jgi:hypothetical protein
MVIAVRLYVLLAANKVFHKPPLLDLAGCETAIGKNLKILKFSLDNVSFGFCHGLLDTLLGSAMHPGLRVRHCVDCDEQVPMIAVTTLLRLHSLNNKVFRTFHDP